jgi:hypothetical protein
MRKLLLDEFGWSPQNSCGVFKTQQKFFTFFHINVIVAEKEMLTRQ